jgi:hypothetical protein
MHAHIDYSSDILELHLAHDLLVSTLSNPLSSESLFPTKCSFASKELLKLPLAWQVHCVSYSRGQRDHFLFSSKAPSTHTLSSLHGCIWQKGATRDMAPLAHATLVGAMGAHTARGMLSKSRSWPSPLRHVLFFFHSKHCNWFLLIDKRECRASTLGIHFSSLPLRRNSLIRLFSFPRPNLAYTPTETWELVPLSPVCIAPLQISANNMSNMNWT